jgi:hypothetical protein
MLGVHGNGYAMPIYDSRSETHLHHRVPRLTHLLWMKPTPRATVIEFFYPQGFALDYQFTVSLGVLVVNVNVY